MRQIFKNKYRSRILYFSFLTAFGFYAYAFAFAIAIAIPFRSDHYSWTMGMLFRSNGG